MKGHLDRAKANEQFLKFIEDNGGNNFPDWKMTVMFYASLHYVKAYLKFNKKPCGNSHKEIDDIINPAKPKAIFPFPQEYYDYYNFLYQNSWEARYAVIYSERFKEVLLKLKCSESKDYLSHLKKYYRLNGLPI